MSLMFVPFLLIFMVEIGLDHRRLLLWRLRRILFGAGVIFQGTEIVLILEKILAMLAVFNELRDSIGEEGGVRKVAERKFGEE